MASTSWSGESVEAMIGEARLGTIDAGNVFGEVALLGEGRRTATVRSRTAARALVLTEGATTELFATLPGVHRKLLIAVGRSLGERLPQANVEIRGHAP